MVNGHQIIVPYSHCSTQPKSSQDLFLCTISTNLGTRTFTLRYLDV